MNESQMAQQIRHVLAAATWPESPSRLVFGDRLAFVVAGLPDEDELLNRTSPSLQSPMFLAVEWVNRL